MMLDYNAAADLFWCSSARRQMPKGSIRFRQFETLTQAVRFVVGDKTEVRFRCAIDTDLGRYEDEEIEALYNRADFPEGRSKAADKPADGVPFS